MSTCSIIQRTSAKNLHLLIHRLAKPVFLSGFLGSGVSTTEYAEAIVVSYRRRATKTQVIRS
jgi:hypothetical protein